MNNVAKDFLIKACQIVPPLKRYIDAVVDDWNPEQPPLTTIFESCSEGIYVCFDELSHLQKIDLFNVIEDGINCPDVELSTAVATGLIEAFVGSKKNWPNQWLGINDSLGPTSRSHADAWAAED